MTSENVDVNPHKSTRRIRPLRKVKHDNHYPEQGTSSHNENIHLTNGFEKHNSRNTKLVNENENCVDSEVLKNQKQNLTHLENTGNVKPNKTEKDRALDYSRHLLNRNFQLEKNDSASEFVKAIISAVDDMNDHNIAQRKTHPKHEEKVHVARKHVKHKPSDQCKRKINGHKDNKSHTNPVRNQLEVNASSHNRSDNDTNDHHHSNHLSKNDECTRKPEQEDDLKTDVENKKPITNGVLTTPLSNFVNQRPVPSPKTNRRLLNSKRVLNQVPENESTIENQATSKYSSLIRYLNNVPEHEHHEEKTNQEEELKANINNNISFDNGELHPDAAKNHGLEVISQNNTHENSQNSSEKSNREDNQEGVESKWQPAVTDRHTAEELDTHKTSQHVPLMFQQRRRSRNEDYCRVRSSDGRPLTASEMRYYRRRPIISPADSRSTNTSIDEDSNNSRTRRRRAVQPWHHLQADVDCALQRRMIHNAIQQKAASSDLKLEEGGSSVYGHASSRTSPNVESAGESSDSSFGDIGNLQRPSSTRAGPSSASAGPSSEVLDHQVQVLDHQVKCWTIKCKCWTITAD
ncbi:hypothetical protein M8J76_000617 [Diaphorina citri]|nr:hypothetical protein M8J76_000617 [Diaphorina citri]